VFRDSNVYEALFIQISLLSRQRDYLSFSLSTRYIEALQRLLDVFSQVHCIPFRFSSDNDC